MLLAASSPLLSCSSCGFDCVQEGVSKCDALASVVAAGHAFERFTRRGGSVEEEDERRCRREIFFLSEERRRSWWGERFAHLHERCSSVFLLGC
jgi:hypothetical protein